MAVLRFRTLTGAPDYTDADTGWSVDGNGNFLDISDEELVEKAQASESLRVAISSGDIVVVEMPAGLDITPAAAALAYLDTYHIPTSPSTAYTLLRRDGAGELPTDVTAGTGITGAQHHALRQLIHFLDDGPGAGFASGAHKETLPAGNPFPTSFIWWESASKLKKIVELTVTRNANKTPSTEVWKIYDTDGSTVLVTLTDTIGYSGIFETSRTRTYA